MKKSQNINEIYLLHILETIFYIPLYESEYYAYIKERVNKNIKDFYVIARKQKSGTYADINSIRKYKESITFGYGYIDTIDEAIPLQEVFNNEELLNNQNIQKLCNEVTIDNNMVLKKVKSKKH